MSESENPYLRALFSGAAAAALERFYMGEENVTRNLMFGGAVAAGIYASDLVTPTLVPNVPSLNEALYNGKTAATRGTEIAVSAVSSYSLNKYVLMNDKYSDEFYTRLAVIAVSNVIGNYAADYYEGRPLGFLTAE